MFGYIRDKWQAARLQARYDRKVRERLLQLLEQQGPQPVAEDPGDWSLVGGTKSPFDESERTDLRSQARRLVQTNPYARNILRLLEIYVTGPGLRAVTAPRQRGASRELLQTAERLWSEFLSANGRHFSYRETARRTWRDGECFLRLFSLSDWPPTVRYVDPETIGPDVQRPDCQGIVTDPDDVETARAYLRIDARTGELAEEIPAQEMLHTKIGVDSNEKRGVTIFAPLLEWLGRFERWFDTELQARRLQASIVLWRKMHGSPSQVSAFAEQAPSTFSGDVRRERYRAGTIVTTSPGIDLQFLHPKTNFSDAAPLGRLVLLSIAAGAGVPEYMLSSDASNGSFASTMVAEGPAVKLFESEQQFFGGEFARLWRWVMGEGIRRGLLPEDFFDRASLQWSFPQLITRDRPKERATDAQLAAAGILSRAEVARRDGVDPATMQAEIAGERESADRDEPQRKGREWA
jgi:capsid protein